MRPEKLGDLRLELDNDPLVIGYAAMDTAQAAASLNAFTRPGPGDLQALRTYLALERNRTNEGGDTVPMQILGRLEIVAESIAGANPFGRLDGAVPPVAIVLTWEQIAAAKALRAYVRDSLGSVDFVNDSRFNTVLNKIRDAGVIAAGDKASIEALSQNVQSRADELDLGRVGASDVADARAL